MSYRINYLRNAFIVLIAFSTLVVTGQAEDPRTLWAGQTPFPSASELQPIEGTRFHVIQPNEPDKDRFHWLHGVAIIWHQGKLFASFGRNAGKENTASEIAQWTTSDDGGATWRTPKLIDDGGEKFAVSHGVFYSNGESLWSFHGAFHGKLQDVHTQAYEWQPNDEHWIYRGVVAKDGFWPMQEPLPANSSRLIMSGFRITPDQGHPAAEAIGNTRDLKSWQLRTISNAAKPEMWGESTVFRAGDRWVNIARWKQPFALVSYSDDHGDTWTMPSTPTNMPMAASKPYTGVLSTGHPYLIGSMSRDGGNRRSPLTIAIGKPGEATFSHVYMIRDAIHDDPGESTANARLSYPYAVEYEGQLYVAYSNDGGRGGNRNSAELAIVPIEALIEDTL